MESLINRVLLTKDGRKIGNAIVVKQETVFTIRTDYGTKARVTESVLREYFHVGEKQGPDHKHFVKQ